MKDLIVYLFRANEDRDDFQGHGKRCGIRSELNNPSGIESNLLRFFLSRAAKRNVIRCGVFLCISTSLVDSLWICRLDLEISMPAGEKV